MPAATLTKTSRKHFTKEELAARESAEEKLKAAAGEAITPPDWLTESQAEIFGKIVDGLTSSGLLGGLDTYLLCTGAIAIDRLQTIEQMLNENPELLTSTKLMGAKDKYTKDFFKCCAELCLSPAARAKIAASITVDAKDKDDELLKAMTGDD